MNESKKKDLGYQTRNPYLLFLWGGISTMCGEFTTLPIDILKVRLQIDAMNNAKGVVSNSSKMNFGAMSKLFLQIVKHEGVLALWSGATPALLRQLLYGSLRLGFYEPVKNILNGNTKETIEHKIPFYKKVLAGVICGSISAAMVTPTDVLKVRMQAGTGFRKTPYRNSFHAVASIVKKEGFIKGLYKGVGATTMRAAIISSIELSVYDDTKFRISQYEIFKPGFQTHLASSLCTGLIASIIANPIDFIKTRLQSQKVDAHGNNLHYKNTLDCLIKTVRTEGITSLGTGFFPHYLRRGPHLVVSFITLEQLRLFGDKYFN